MYSKAENLAKIKAVPFVNANLYWFLPVHARSTIHQEESEEENESETLKCMRKVMGVQKQQKKSMTFLQCIEALHRYIIAGAACKQFKLSSGLAHISVIMEVAPAHDPKPTE